MKKLIFIIATVLSYLNVFAQEAKPCLFIGRYDTEKKFMCSDQAWVYEEVKDRQEYDLKRKQFNEEHKPANPSTEFVSSKECVIVFQYQINRSSFNCYPSIYALTKGTTIENCKNELATVLAKDPKHFKTQPNIIFTWQGKGVKLKETITEDFGGVAGTFYLIDKPNGGSFVVAQLRNTTTDKRAVILLKTVEGKTLERKYLEPGGTLTAKYDTKSLEVQVIYEDNKKPKSEANLIDFVKDVVRKQITNENSKLKAAAIWGVRG